MVLSHVFPRAAAAVIGLVLASPLCLPVPASANVVFDFNGVCATGCSGIATGVLTLADSYVFGSDITTLELISFDYSSSQFSFNLTSSDVAFIAGGLNADGSFNSTENLTVQALTSTPVFLANAVGFAAYQTTDEDDHGSPFVFSLVTGASPGAVPESSTWTMMAMGFAGLGFMGWRGSRRAVVRA